MSFASACMRSTKEIEPVKQVEPPIAAETTVDSVPIAESAVEEREADDGHRTGALETYRYWAGHDPEEDMQVLHGEYWASAHWSKEYTLFMELRFDDAEDFVFANKFERSEKWMEIPAGAPDWFKPRKHYQVWKGGQSSLYYLDPKRGHLYMYEVQF
jgi:hypothetical protein